MHLELHPIFMCDGVHCGPHYRAAQSKSHYTSGITIYHNQCSESSTGTVACTAQQEPSVHCCPCSANPTLEYLLSTRMEIHDVTQHITGHCRAFNVPPWTPHSPRRLPFRFSLLAFLQQMKMQLNKRAGTSDRL